MIFLRTSNMDLAHMIAESAAENFKKECESNVCEVKINAHCRYNYSIFITPMANHILVKYKTMEYKVPKDNAGAYENVVSFLAEAISDEVAMTMDHEIEFKGYWPHHDEAGTVILINYFSLYSLMFLKI